jgi:hypothetical protein
MPGPPPKDPAVRQRRNKKAEATELTAPTDVRVPAIPNPDKRKWHKLTKIWWRNVWRSPMAPRYLNSDRDQLGFVALLVDDFYLAGNAKERRELAAEIRQQTARFGLSNWDRNRMNWTVTEATDKKPAPQASTTPTGTDPRKLLKFNK